MMTTYVGGVNFNVSEVHFRWLIPVAASAPSTRGICKTAASKELGLCIPARQ